MRFRFGAVWLDAIRFADAVRKVCNMIEDGRPAVVSVMNLRTIVLSASDDTYASIINKTALRLTDGMPLVWAGKIMGIKNIERVTGPDLFVELLSDKYDYRHFFLGDTEDVLLRLIEKAKKENEKVAIAGYLSPPFKDFNSQDIIGFSEQIIQSSPDLIWVALGSPKQDYFCDEIVKHLDSGVLLNVGAAFRFYIGEYQHPKKFFQHMGLEGVFWRFTKNPKKEFIWYSKHSVLLVYLIFVMLYKKKKNIQTD